MNKIKSILSDVRLYWNIPMQGKYITFKEIAAYCGGGIGAYALTMIGNACILSTNNTLLSSTLGINPTDMYIMYVIAVLANIPLTGIRANIIDNTRNKAGKYRPYIVTMAIPTAIICLATVWFPYDKLSLIVGEGMIFGETRAYVAKCALIMLFNFLLHFCFYFFYDSYENLIHVLSPNSQERAEVASIKSVVYSFAPTVVNLFTPIIAKNIFHTNTTDIRVYRLLYPILTVLGILLCIIVYKHTEEKIVQAKTHVVHIKFSDALRAVAKNKYFWIISLASWIGFLESAYSNILAWLYNYGGACNGNEYALIVTVYGNASLWGMILAPFCIKRWGKKAVLIVTNLFNILFILMMYPFLSEIKNGTIWLIMGCLYMNALVGSFARILNPSIQADIRDYQQYKTGERIDGMFSAVTTIGTVIALVTSSVLPYIYEKGGITKANAAAVTSNPTILSRVLGDGKTVGQILTDQLANGQDNYTNAYSALYDPDILLSLLKVLVLVAAFGAFMNVLPFFAYDFNEIKQKSVVRVLKVRALFEDYGNGITNDSALVEGIDIIRNAREMAVAEPKAVDKKTYKAALKNSDDKKAVKKAYKADLAFNDEITISKFVCEELDKFSSAMVKRQVADCNAVYAAGIQGLVNAEMSELKAELKAARALSKNNTAEKEYRSFTIDMAKNKIAAYKTIKKFYKNTDEIVKPDFAILEGYYDREDQIDETIKALYIEEKKADKGSKAEKKAQIKALSKEKAELKKTIDAEMDKHANFNRIAKPLIVAERLVKQAENYTHLDDIAEKYEESKKRSEEERAAKVAEQKRLEAEKQAQKEKRLAEKSASKK
ncbi:MAG: MFS transporter [Clostridia bacterium]|nr:MFS transporter [Clostridia bacterium]